MLYFNDRSVGPTLSQLQYFVRVLSEVAAFMEMVEGHHAIHGNGPQPWQAEIQRAMSADSTIQPPAGPRRTLSGKDSRQRSSLTPPATPGLTE